MLWNSLKKGVQELNNVIQELKLLNTIVVGWTYTWYRTNGTSKSILYKYISNHCALVLKNNLVN